MYILLASTCVCFAFTEKVGRKKYHFTQKVNGTKMKNRQKKNKKI